MQLKARYASLILSCISRNTVMGYDEEFMRSRMSDTRIRNEIS